MDTASEEYRHQCEVRYILALTKKNRRAANEYMETLKEKAPERWLKLKIDCNFQWHRGNRGEFGKWVIE